MDKYSLVRNITDVQHHFETCSFWMLRLREGRSRVDRNKYNTKAAHWEDTRHGHNSGPIQSE